MKKILNLMLVLLLASFFVNAQNSFRKVYSTAPGSSTIPIDILQTSDSNYLLMSHYGQGSMGNILLNKINADGNSIWAREIALTSDHLDPMITVDLNNNGYLIVAHGDVRWIDSTLFIQLDTSGNMVGSQGIANYQPEMACFNPSDSSILMEMNYGTDNQIVKYDVHGFIKWAKIFNEPNGIFFGYHSLHSLNEGAYLVYCEYENGVLVIKIDSSGGIIYNKTFVPVDSLLTLQPLDFVCTSDNSMIISYIVHESQNMKLGYLLIDSMGTEIKNKTYYYPSFVGGFWNLSERDGDVFISISPQTSSGKVFATVLQVDSLLNFKNMRSLSDTTFDELSGPINCGNNLLFTSTTYNFSESYVVSKTDSVNHLICGGLNFNVTEDSLQLNYSSIVFTTTPLAITSGPNLTNIVVNPLTVNVSDYCGTTLNTPEVEHLNFSVFPNPVVDQTIQLNFTAEKTYSCVADIFDISGRRVLQTPLDVISGNNKREISIKNLDPGIYFLVINGDAGKRSVKFIKQ